MPINRNAARHGPGTPYLPAEPLEFVGASLAAAKRARNQFFGLAENADTLKVHQDDPMRCILLVSTSGPDDALMMRYVGGAGDYRPRHWVVAG